MDNARPTIGTDNPPAALLPADEASRNLSLQASNRPSVERSRTEQDLTGQKLSDGELSKIVKENPDLKGLFLTFSTVSDSQIGAVRQAKHLTDLDLSFTKITDSGMKSVGEVAGLRSLGLVHSMIGNDGLKPVSHLRGLAQLDLTGTKTISDSGIANLSHLNGLQMLRLTETGITDRGLKHLSTLTNLKDLDLSGTAITWKGLGALAKLDKLENLNLSNTELTDEGVAQIAHLPNLHRLNLSHTKISAKSLDYLKAMPTLMGLDVTGDKVKKSDVEWFHGFDKPECDVVSDVAQPDLHFRGGSHAFAFEQGSMSYTLRQQAKVRAVEGDTISGIAKDALALAYNRIPGYEPNAAEISTATAQIARANKLDPSAALKQNQFLWIPDSVLADKIGPKSREPVAGSSIVYSAGASPEFSQSIAEMANRLPKGVSDILQEKGAKVVAAGEPFDADVAWKYLRPRGHSDTDGELNGSYIPKLKEAIITENIRTTSNELVKVDPSKIEHVFAHETGHALDAALDNFSNSADFKREYAKDLEAMTPAIRQAVSYFVQPNAAGREETMAEVFAVVSGHGDEDDAFVKIAFPNVTKLVENKLAEIAARKSNSD